jgi:large subunit ribosomal protein L21
MTNSNATDRYAIIKTGGKQYRVTEGSEVDVELLDAEVGSSVQFKEVLFVNDGTSSLVGVPHVAGWLVSGEVIAETAGAKITCMKYKKRKNQRRKFGHRQHYTRVKITSIAQ